MATILLLLNYESLKLFYFFQVSNMSNLKRRAPIDEQEDEKPLKRSHKQTEEEEEQDSDDGLQVSRLCVCLCETPLFIVLFRK